MLATAQNTPLNKKGTIVPGILQRYEIQQLIFDAKLEPGQGTSFSQQLEIITDSDTNPTRCPCCHCSHVKLICVNCLNTNVIRIGKICEEKRRYLSSKNAICQLIQSALYDERNFETEFHQLRRSIEELHTKIAWKREQIGRLRQRISNTVSQSERNRRNVALLEKKTIVHSDRINRAYSKKAELMNILTKTKSKLQTQTITMCPFIFWIFRLEKHLLDGDGPTPAWSRQPKLRRSVFSLNSCLCLDRNSLLEAASSDLSPPKSTNHFPYESLAALSHAAQFVELLAHLFHFTLPYPRLHHDLMLISTRGCLPPSEANLRKIHFKLDYTVLLLCLTRGVLSDDCILTEPLANLHTLIQMINRAKISNCVARVEQRLHREVCENFGAVQPDGRVFNEFTLDNVENDWVKVHCSN